VYLWNFYYSLSACNHVGDHSAFFLTENHIKMHFTAHMKQQPSLHCRASQLFHTCISALRSPHHGQTLNPESWIILCKS